MGRKEKEEGPWIHSIHSPRNLAPINTKQKHKKKLTTRKNNKQEEQEEEQEETSQHFCKCQVKFAPRPTSS